MSTTINFLEMMGRDARLRHASNADIAQVLTGEGVDLGMQKAILNKDLQQVEALLGGSPNVCCVLGVVEEERDGGDSPAVRHLPQDNTRPRN
jgi:hypothetical protein